ncbi:ExbD/TolR family protein [Candidatus Latescibacterota bacterium]
MRFRKRMSVQQSIPTGPMADISFLLIIFFMVTTVFVVYRGFQVNLPLAERIEPLRQRRNVVSIWIAHDGRIKVDEYEADLTSVGSIVGNKLQENPRIVVQIKSDRNTPYRLISGIIEELKRVNALRVSFIAKKE